MKTLIPIGVDRVAQRADAANDGAILRLENLDTDLRPPAEAIAATHSSLEDQSVNSYLPFLGQDEMRIAACAQVARASGIEYDWQTSCVITAGGLNGVLCALLAVTQAGDEIIVTDPVYAGFLNRITIAGGVPRFVSLNYTLAGWRLDLDELGTALGPKTRALLLMSPSMPSGAVFTLDEWNAIARFCTERNLLLLYDAAMERIVFDDAPVIHPAALPGMKNRTLTIGSVSKEYRMIGWRVGWVVGPPELIERVGRVSIANAVTPVGIAQRGAACALQGNQGNVRAAITEWQRRHNVVLGELLHAALLHFGVCAAQGGWSMLVDVSGAGIDGQAAAQRLMECAKVAVTPMAGWGTARMSRFIRIVYSNEPRSRLHGLGAKFREAFESL